MVVLRYGDCSGTVKNMSSYCISRFSQKSTQKLKNKGLIYVKRFLKEGDENMKKLTETNDIVWELAHRSIISDSDLWVDKLQKKITLIGSQEKRCIL